MESFQSSPFLRAENVIERDSHKAHPNDNGTPCFSSLATLFSSSHSKRMSPPCRHDSWHSIRARHDARGYTLEETSLVWVDWVVEVLPVELDAPDSRP